MNRPTLAVIIPCFNEELCIERTVNALFTVLNSLIEKNKINPNSYLYLVDDGSVDSSVKLAAIALSQLMLIFSRMNGLLRNLLMNI